MKINCIDIDDEHLALDIISAYSARIPFLNLLKTFDNAIDTLEYLRKDKGRTKPVVVLATTVMGKGVPFFEGTMPDKSNWHGKAPSKEDEAKALEILGVTNFGDF